MNSINESYDFLIDIFEQKKVFINEIKRKESINLLLIININKEEKKSEIILKYNSNIKNEKSKNHFYCKNKIKISAKLEQNNLSYLCDLPICPHSYSNDSFTSFTSIYDILYLIFSDFNRSILAYNLDNTKIIIEIKNAHNSYIINFRHYTDKYNKRDLIISISCDDKNIKLWNVNDWNCIINIENIYLNSLLSSACILFDNNHNFIISSYCNSSFIHEKCKVFNFKGNKTEEIIDSNNINDNIYFIDSFFDNKLNKNYIITCNIGFIKSYDYKLHKIYHIYNDNENENNIHISAITYK
jgi:hypothetical protein